MKNQEVAEIFNSMADLLEIKGENPFRIRAYRRAAQNIDGLSRDISGLKKEEILEIPGIGNDLADKIGEIVKTGTLNAYEQLKEEVPSDITALLSIPGLGPKTARLLLDRLHIRDIDHLEDLAREHKLSGIRGIKEKTEENILKGIEMLKRGRERHALGMVLPIAEDILRYLEDKAQLHDVCIAGSLRRGKDTIKDIDILAASDEAKKVMNVFVHMPHVKTILMQGPTKSSVVLGEGIQVDLRVVEKGSFGAALAYFTGSKAHNIRLRDMAVRLGLKLNEYGIFKDKDGKKLGGEREEDIYRVLGLPYIPPEMREDRGEIEAAIEGKLPSLITLDDIKGDLHVHSRWSDGSYGFEDLISACRERGYEYIAITDHSKGLGIAKGLSEQKILEQIKEIDSLNKRLRGFRLLKGSEVDIRSDNTLDFPDEILNRLDIVVAAIHSGFKQAGEKLTARLISAMKNPYVTVIAHPTGRLIGQRESYDVDMEDVLKAAKDTGTALEINAYPLRLDLNDVYSSRAREMSVPIIISTDAHLLEHFDYMSYGVSTARRAWLERKDVVNTAGVKEILKVLKRKTAL